MKRKEKKEKEKLANSGVNPVQEQGLTNYYTGYVEGIKKYLKGLP